MEISSSDSNFDAKIRNLSSSSNLKSSTCYSRKAPPPDCVISSQQGDIAAGAGVGSALTSALDVMAYTNELGHLTSGKYSDEAKIKQYVNMKKKKLND